MFLELIPAGLERVTLPNITFTEATKTSTESDFIMEEKEEISKTIKEVAPKDKATYIQKI